MSSFQDVLTKEFMLHFIPEGIAEPSQRGIITQHLVTFDLLLFDESPNCLADTLFNKAFLEQRNRVQETGDSGPFLQGRGT